MHGGLGWDAAAGGAHPVADTVTAIGTALDAVTDCPLYGLGSEQRGDLLATVVGLESRLASLRLRLLCAAEAAGTAEQAGAPNTASWLRANTRTDRVVAGRAVKLAKSLDGEFTLHRGRPQQRAGKRGAGPGDRARRGGPAVKHRHRGPAAG